MVLLIKAENREAERKKNLKIREQGLIPGVLYGPKIDTSPVQVEGKTFEKIYKEAGESSLINLKVGDKEFPVLIYDVQRDPLSRRATHVDFYQPDLDKEVEVTVPLVFEGEPQAVSELGGTLLHNIQEVQVKALPQNLPHEIVVNVEGLKTFEDRITVKDLMTNPDVTIVRDAEDTIAQVVPVQDVEKELEKPVAEDVEGVEKVEGEEATEEKAEEGDEKKATT